MLTDAVMTENSTHSFHNTEEQTMDLAAVAKGYKWRLEMLSHTCIANQW